MTATSTTNLTMAKESVPAGLETRRKVDSGSTREVANPTTKSKIVMNKTLADNA